MAALDPLNFCSSEVAKYMAGGFFSCGALCAAAGVSKAWREVFTDELVAKAVYCSETVHRVGDLEVASEVLPGCPSWLALCAKASRGPFVCREISSPYSVDQVGVLSNGSVLVVSFDGSHSHFQQWDPMGKGDPSFARILQGRVSEIAPLPNQKMLVKTFGDGFSLVDFSLPWEESWTKLRDGYCKFFKLQADRFALSDHGNNVEIFDGTGVAPRGELVGHEAEVSAAVELPSGEVCTASRDKTIRVWNWFTEEELVKLVGHTNWVNDLSLLPNGDLASVSLDGTVRVWSVASGQQKMVRNFGINLIRFFYGGEWLELINSMGAREIWQRYEKDKGVDFKPCLGTANRREGEGWRECAEIEDGRLITKSNYGWVRVWNPSKKHPLEAAIKTVSNLVKSSQVRVAQLPDGRLLTGVEKRIAVWTVPAKGADYQAGILPVLL